MKTPNIYEGNYRKLKVAICQIATKQWDVKGNYEKILNALEESAQKGADIAITPECSIHGYGFDGTNNLFEETKKYSFTIDSEIIKSICLKVKELNIYTLLGFSELEGDNIYNTAILISKNGEIVYKYRKVHCRNFEDKKFTGPFTAGEDFYVEKISGEEGEFSLGTIICFDREVPESIRTLRKLGAEFIACPLACDTEDLYNPKYTDNETVTRVRAVENEVFIAVVNHAERFNGGSYIVGPGGKILHQMGKEAGVDVVEVPLGVIKDRFHNDPLSWMGFGYRRPEVYKKY